MSSMSIAVAAQTAASVQCWASIGTAPRRERDGETASQGCLPVPGAHRGSPRRSRSAPPGLAVEPASGLPELPVRLARRAVRVHQSGVEAGAALDPGPLVVVEPRDPRAHAAAARVVLVGQLEHVLRPLGLTALVALERRQELQDP